MFLRSAGFNAVASSGVAWLGVFALALGSSACGIDPAAGEACSMVSGDLVISELMINPEGDPDDPSEWIEIYNASADAVVLNRMVLRRESISTSSGNAVVQVHDVVNAGTLGSHEYFVFGGAKGSHVDYSLGGQVDLSNTGAVISLECQGKLIDEMRYGDRGGAEIPPVGRSLSFDGGVAPDALLNEGEGYWCAVPIGGSPYDDANFGTPGQANEPCGFATCLEDGESRDVQPPGPGDLIITELFANPSGADAGKEWLEVYVDSAAPVDLNGLEILSINLNNGNDERQRLTDLGCVTGTPGSYLVLGASADIDANGGVPVDAVIGGLTFSNDVPFELTLQRGSVIIDEASLPAGSDSKAVKLDPSRLSLAGNDAADSFCKDTAQGTPGAENSLCPLISCRDGSDVRDVVSPGPGEVLVSEVFAEPSGSGSGRDWIELHIDAVRGVDLNGLVIVSQNAGTTSKQTFIIESQPCVEGVQGGYVVVGAPADPDSVEEPLQDDELDPDVLVPGLSFYNDVPLIITLSLGDELVDVATVPASSRGQSASVALASLTPTGNDDPANYCYATSTGLFAEQGTPGLGNICGGECSDSGTIRPAILPESGEVVITEVMANPNGTDNGHDWVEVYNGSGNAVDLNGLWLINTSPAGSTNEWTVEGATCINLASGAYAVLGGGNVSAHGVTALATLLNDSGGSLGNMFFSSFTGVATLSLEREGEVIDVISYPTLSSGQGYLLEAGVLSATANDDPTNWCKATTASAGYTGGNGSPGVANPACP
jgi:hypothetical protein